LRRILDCIKYLISQNLALRGHEESVSLDVHNNDGNILSVIKLVAQNDTLLENTFKIRNKIQDLYLIYSPQFK